jgi:hypothetical protein
MDMPKALTPQEKRERSLAELGATVAQDSTVKPDERPGKRVRNAFNGTTGKLKVDFNIPGYHGYIFNDTPGRIETALQGGWEFVTPEEIGKMTENVVSRNTDLGSKVRFLVGKTDTGGPLYAYLMKIKQEWWEEDQAALQERNNKVDAAIKRGKVPGQDTEGFYVPSGGISIKG